MRQFVTRVGCPVVAILMGVTVTGVGTILGHMSWSSVNGELLGIHVWSLPQLYATFLWDFMRPSLTWWIPAFCGGTISGLIGMERGWLYGVVCGLASVSVFASLLGNPYYFTREWNENVAVAYPLGATAGGAVAHWINWVRQQTGQKGLSHV